MIEIRIHGRGGQGGVTLSKLISTSRFLQGLSVQSFGLYAAERSGAPIQAFCRYSEDPITNRNLIYEPDHVIVLDPTLVGPPIAAGLKAGGWILINSPQRPQEFADQFPRNRIATVDATSIARENKLGTRSVPIVNTALAGAVGKMLAFPLQEVSAALEHLSFTASNLMAASRAYEEVQLIETPTRDRTSRRNNGASSWSARTQFPGGCRKGAAGDQDGTMGHRAAAPPADDSTLQSRVPGRQQRAGIPQRPGPGRTRRSAADPAPHDAISVDLRESLSRTLRGNLQPC